MVTVLLYVPENGAVSIARQPREVGGAYREQEENRVRIGVMSFMIHRIE